MPEAIADLKLSDSPPAKPKARKPAPSSAEPEKPAETPEPLEIPVCTKNAFRFRESCSNRYLVKLPEGVSMSQAADKPFMEVCLMIKSRDFTSFDEIMAVSADATWCCEWMVIDSEAGVLNLAFQRSHVLEQRNLAGEQRVPAGFSIHRDRIDGFYYVQRDADGHKFIDGCYRFEDALRQLLDNAMFRNN